MPEWKRERRSGGGVSLDLASHHFDLMRFLFDQEIADVGALLRSVETEDDTAAVELRLEGGPLVTIFASLVGVEEDRVEVYGSRGQTVPLERVSRAPGARSSALPAEAARGAKA